jgi:hypothetical protein
MNERRKDFMKIKFLFGRKFFYSFHEKDKKCYNCEHFFRERMKLSSSTFRTLKFKSINESILQKKDESR